ncbi:MAG TPA: hypothetical protein PK264_00810 [Hyphomicrobiaceae bacterium]|nr:hypothetical protein [Hyphomicrobiaceae bacterium]
MRAPSSSRRRRHRQEAASSPAASHASAPARGSPTRWRGKYLFDNAVGFLAGARHLVSSDPHSREIFLQLIGCAVELALKSYLHFAGWDDDRCRAEVRHDLVKALAAAERLGFHRRHPDVRMLTRILSPYYCCHRTRELARREPTPLSSERALRAAEGLLDDVLAAVAARPRSKG